MQKSRILRFVSMIITIKCYDYKCSQYEFIVCIGNGKSMGFVTFPAVDVVVAGAASTEWRSTFEKNTHNWNCLCNIVSANTFRNVPHFKKWTKSIEIRLFFFGSHHIAIVMLRCLIICVYYTIQLMMMIRLQNNIHICE